MAPTKKQAATKKTAKRPPARTKKGPVVAAVEGDLKELPKPLAASGLAAVAVAMARELDDTGNSATSKSMCARSLLDALERLKSEMPEAEETDDVDDLAARRAERLARGAAAKA